jgi:hypothetical protein
MMKGRKEYRKEYRKEGRKEYRKEGRKERTSPQRRAIFLEGDA